MQCHVVRQNADTGEEIISLRNCFLMGPLNWGNGPVMHLNWRDDETVGPPWGNVAELRDPHIHIIDHFGHSIIILGYAPSPNTFTDANDGPSPPAK